MQFLLLFWKNWIIQKRKVCCTIIEVAIPVALALILFLIRQLVDIENVGNTIWENFDVANETPALFPTGRNYIIGYTPVNTHTTQIAADTAIELNAYFSHPALVTRFIPQGNHKQHKKLYQDIISLCCNKTVFLVKGRRQEESFSLPPFICVCRLRLRGRAGGCCHTGLRRVIQHHRCSRLHQFILWQHCAGQLQIQAASGFSYGE